VGAKKGRQTAGTMRQRQNHISAHCPPRPRAHLVYVTPALVASGQGRYALIGHHLNPGMAPSPPMILPLPSQLQV
jgi:hypothetical protein